MTSRLKSIHVMTRGAHGRYALAIVALVVASLLLYLAPLVVQATLDAVIGGAEPGRLSAFALRALGGADAVATELWRPATAIIVITALAGLFTWLRGRWSALATEHVVHRLRTRAYDHLQRLPCRAFDRASTGDLVQRCTSDVETMRTFLGTQIVEIGRAVIMLVAPIPFMLMIDWRMTIAALLLVPFVVGFSMIYFRGVRVAFKAVDESEGRLTACVQENLSGIRVVRAYARQAYEREKFAERNEEYRGLDLRLFELLARFWSISDLICFLQKGLVLGCGVVLLVRDELSVGAFFFFISAVSMFIWPVRMMGRILSDLGKALVAFDRLQEILDEPEETADDETTPLGAWAGGVTFENVSFAHGDAAVLHDVSFTVEPGQTLALIGPSGSGKSTIVNLLLRLYDYERDGSGTIRLDDRDLATIDRADVRRACAVVLQEPFLFSRSLRDNLALARPGAAEEELIEATMIACVHDSIERFEDGYDTVVGERGATLSGGQRQRVALARALIADPALLVLDDAMSAVDAETEAQILAALRARRGAHTTIVIAHRLATLRHADLILVLDQGRVVQRGAHHELIAEDGLYQRLWSMQTASVPEAEARSRGQEVPHG